MPIYEVTSPDGLTYELEGPEGDFSQEHIIGIAQQLIQAGELQPIAPKEAPSFFESIGQGVDMMQKDFGSLLNSVGHSLDWDELKSAGLKIRDRNIQEIQNKQYTEPDWRDIFEEEGLSAKTKAGLDYLVHQVGVNLPQMLGIGAGGIAGGIAGGPAGAFAGATAMGTGVFTASNASRRTEEGLEPDLLKEVGYAIPQAAAETAFLGVISKTGLSGPMKAFLGKLPDGATKTIVGKTGEAIAINIPSEVAQQAMERAAADLDITTPEAIEEYKDAIAGAIAVGGGIGAGAGILKVGKDKLSGVELPKRGEKDEPPNLEETDISQEAVLPQELPQEAPKSPFDLPVTEAPEFSDVTVDGKHFQDINNFEEQSKADILKRRAESLLYTKDDPNIAKPLGLNEAVHLYPEGIPDPILKKLIPSKPSPVLARSKFALDAVLDRINKIQDQVLSRDEWLEHIDKNPFGKGKLKVTFKAKLNKKLPASLGRIHKDTVVEALKDIRSSIEVNERNVNPKAYPDEKLIPVRKTKAAVPQAAKGSYFRTSTSLTPNGFGYVSPKALVRRVPNFSDVYEAAASPSSQETSVLDNNTLNLKLGTVNAEIKNLGKLENTIRRVVNEVGSKTQNFLGSVFEQLRDGKKSLEDPARFVGLNLMTNLSLKIGDMKSKNYLKDNPLYLEEFWHFLHDSTDFMTDADKAKLESGMNNMLKTIAKQGVFVEDIMTMGTNEIFAHVFADYAASRRNPGAEPLDVGVARPVFDRVYNLLMKQGQALRGQGIKDSSDIFGVSKEDFNAALYDIRKARYKMLGEAQMDKFIDESAVAAHEFAKTLEKNPPKTVDANQLPQTFFHFNFWRTAAGMAQKVADFAPFVTTFSRKENRVSELLHEKEKMIGNILKKRPQIFRKVSEVMDHMRSTDQKAIIDEAGQRIIFKRGKKRVAISDPQFFEDFKAIAKFYEEDLKNNESNVREALPAYGLDEDASVSQVDNEVSRLERILKKEKDKKQKKLIEGDISDLKQIAAQLRTLERLKKTQYIPRMRFGDYVVWVWDKEAIDEDTGKPTLIYHSQYEQSDNPFQRYNKEQIDNIQKDIQKKGYLNNSRYEVIGGGFGKDGKHHKVTYNKLVSGLPTARATLENIYSLLGGGYIDGYMSVMEDTLTQDQKDTLSELSGKTDEFSNKKRAEILRRAKIRNMSRVLMKSEDIDGYSKDWERVINAYSVASTKHQVESEFRGEAALLEGFKNKLEKDGDIPETYMKFINRFYDYNTSPANDYLPMRALNFIWTMGANTSTAILQFMNGPMAVVPAIMQWDANPIRANIQWAKAMKTLSTDFMFRQTDFGTGQTDSFGDAKLYDKLVSQGKLSRVEADVLQKLYKSGIIDSMLTQEYTGRAEMAKAEKSGAVKGAKKLGRWLGFGISVAEQGGRWASAKTIVASLLDSDGRLNQDKFNTAINLYKNDPMFVQWNKQNTDMTALEAFTSFVLMETHGLYDKSGRGELQRGIFGAALTPFMTHSTTQLQLLGDLANRRGGKGRAGAMYMMSTYLVFGGLMALPGAELLKEFYDLVEQMYTGSKDDAILDLRKALVESGMMSPTLALAFTKGVVRANTPADTSARITLPLPFQNPLSYLLNMMSGETTDTSRLLGPSVGILEGGARALQKRDPTEMLPVAMKNAMKGLISYRPDDSLFGSGAGAMTRSGNRLVSADEFTTSERILKTLGFALSKEGDARDMMYASLLEDTGFRDTQSRFVKEIAREYERADLAKARGDMDKYRKHEENGAVLFDRLLTFLEKEGIPMTKDKYRGLYNSINDRSLQLYDPDNNPYWSKTMKYKADQFRNIYKPER